MQKKDGLIIHSAKAGTAEVLPRWYTEGYQAINDCDHTNWYGQAAGTIVRYAPEDGLRFLQCLNSGSGSS